MKPAILCFTGSIASGKSTLSNEVASYLKWKHASFGNYVRYIARSQGLDESRETLQEVGASLASQGIEIFCRAMLEHFNWQPRHPLVIDGVRHVEVVSTLRHLVLPLELVLIFVTVNESTRQKRLAARGLTYDRQQKVEIHSTEIQVRENLADIAALKVNGAEKLEKLVAEIVERLA